MIPKNQYKIVVLNELERKQKSIEQLKSKLECYLCTPQTYSRFEKKAILITALQRATVNTDQLLSVLKKNYISIMDNIDNVERQLIEHRALEQKVIEYLNTARQ
ncbi:hypothetical protein OAE12_01050 [bacterium]|nr:hypothetical protein [bacterium]